MAERLKRHWNYFTRDQIKAMAAQATSDSVWRGGLSSPLIVRTVMLNSKVFQFIFQDGRTMDYAFLDENRLSWRVDGGASHEDIYVAEPCPGHEAIAFVHHYKAGLELPECCDLVIDLETSLVTAIEAVIGNSPYPREVEHEIRFGQIAGAAIPAQALRHDYTTELVGKAVHWSSPNAERPGIKYIFSSPHYLTYVSRFTGTNAYWMSTIPTDYIKIRDSLYLASAIEERQGGYQLNMLMNMTILRDCQSGFGVGTGGPAEQPDCLEMRMNWGRHGSYTTMDTIP